MLDALKQTSDVIQDHQSFVKSFTGQDLVQWFIEREGDTHRDNVSIEFILLSILTHCVYACTGVCTIPTLTEGWSYI